jgi:RNase P/RNase MRP subunit p29
MMALVAAVIGLGVAHVSAHDEYRIIGTIAARKGAQLDVKRRDGKMLSVKVDGETLVYRDNKKIAATELMAGRHVVVDALGDSEADLLAVEIRIVASLPK